VKELAEISVFNPRTDLSRANFDKIVAAFKQQPDLVSYAVEQMKQECCNNGSIAIFIDVFVRINTKQSIDAIINEFYLSGKS
jgi:hypothetical protein